MGCKDLRPSLFLVLMFMWSVSTTAFSERELSSNPYLVRKDSISGELVKPQAWSEERFRLFKILRIRDLMDLKVNGIPPDPQLFPEENESFEEMIQSRTKPVSRAKRTAKSTDNNDAKVVAPSSKIEASLIQQTLTFPKLEKLDEDITIAGSGFFENSILTRFARFGEDVLAFVVDGSSEGEVRIFKVTSTNIVEIQPMDEENKLKIDFSKNSDARITDVVLLDPNSEKYFLCVTVDWKMNQSTVADYSRMDPSKSESESNKNDLDIMKLNIPKALPNEGRSRMFRFEIDNAKLSYKADDMAKEGLLIPSIEAKDAETWMVRNQLFLAIAHKGNTAIESQQTQSLLYKVSNYKNDMDLLELYQGDDSDTNLYASNPRQVKHVKVHSRLFLVFASFNDPISSNPNPKSQVYRYDYNTKKYELWQELQTFGAVGVEYLAISDEANPLNDKHFIVFANQVEKGEGSWENKVESIVYKYSKGKFLPFQALKVDEPIQVATIENYLPDTIDINGIESYALNQAIVFLQKDGKLKIFQFDGTRFKSSDVEEQGLRLFQTLNLSKNELRFVGTLENNSTKIFVPTFESLGLGSNDRLNDLKKYCSEQNTERNNYNIRELKQKYDNAPKKTDNKINLNKLRIGDEGSITFVNSTNSIQLGNNNSLQDDTTPQLNILDEENDEANENIHTINGLYLKVINNLTEHLDINMKRLNDLKKFVQEDAVRTDQINTIKSPVSFRKIVVENLIATEISVDAINAKTGDYKIDTDVFFNNLVYIDPTAEEAASTHGYTFYNSMKFKNISINGEFSFQKLGGKNLAEYVNLESERTITGKKTFSNGARFEGDVNVAETINGIKVTKSNILLKRGDQQLSDKFNFQNIVNINSLKVDKMNEVDINKIMLTAVSKEADIFAIGSSLTVDTLNLEGNIIGLDKIGLLDGAGNKIPDGQIPLQYLVENTMKKSKANDVSVQHTYSDLEVKGNVDLKKTSWPDNFFYIGDNSSVIEKQTETLKTCPLHFEDVTFKEEVNVTESVTTYCEDDSDHCTKNTTIELDDSGLYLDLLLKTKGPDGYSHKVTADKFFTEIVLGEDSEVSGLVQGFDLKYLQNNGTFEKFEKMRKEYFLSSFTIEENMTVGELIISDGIIYQTPKGSEEEQENDLTDLFENGLQKSLTHFPSNVKSIFFKEAVFEENVDVDSLNGHDPEDAYIKKTGENNVNVLGSMTFADDVEFTENILQERKSKIEVCKLDSTRKNCLCEAEACKTTHAYCKLNGRECIVDPDMDGSDKMDYTSDDVLKVSEDLRDIKRLGLTVDTDQNLTSSDVVFENGFDVNELKVLGDTCTVNSIKCENIAVSNQPQTFTGNNKIPGMVIAKKGIKVVDSITVTGTVNDVNMETLYDETLLRNSDERQVIEGRTTIENEFTFDNLQTNNGLLNNVNLTEVMQRLNATAILKTGGSVTINTDLEFTDDITMDALNPQGTVDGVNITDFLHNLWLNDAEQTITGDLTFEQNLSFGSTLLQAPGYGHGGMINNVDIEYLEKNAFRHSGDKGPKHYLGDVEFGELVSNEIKMESGAKFHDINLSQDAIMTEGNKGKIVITGEKTLVDFEVNGQMEVTGHGEVMGNVLEKNGKVDRLWKFLDGEESVKRLSIKDGSIYITNEPSIESINGYSLAGLKKKGWYRNRDTILPINIKMESAIINGRMDMETPIVNDVDLVDWRDNYLSISKPQTITGDYTFSKGVVFLGNVSVPKIQIENDRGEEQYIVTEDGKPFKFKSSLVDKSFSKKKNYDHILANLEFSEVVIKKNLSGMETINNKYVMSRDFLTYKEGDEKIITHKVNLIGNLTIGDKDFKLRDQMVWLEHEQNTLEELFITGLEVGNGKIKFQPEMLARNTVNKNLKSAEISGNKTFTSNQEIVNFNLDGNLINGVSIGTYENPAILLTTKDQTLTDEMVIDGADVTINNLNVGCDPEGGDGIINGIVISRSGKCDFNIPRISRTQDIIKITGLKKFEKSPTFGQVKPHIVNSIFGVELDFLQGIEEPYINMSYPGDRQAPNITKAIENLRQIDSIEMPQAFLFMKNLNDENLNNDKLLRRTVPLFDMNEKHLLPRQLLAGLREGGDKPAEIILSELPLPGSREKLEPIYEKQFHSSLPKSFVNNEPLRRQKIIPLCAGKHVCVYVAMVNSKDINDFNKDEIISNSTFEGKEVDGYHLYSLSLSQEEKLKVRQYKKAGTLKDIEPLNVETEEGIKSCVILCYDDEKQEIHCLNANGTFSMMQDVDGLSNISKCYMATSTHFSNQLNDGDGHMYKTMFALATNKNRWDGGVSLWRKINGTISNFQDIDCYWCSHIELGTLIDPLTNKHRVFFVTMSYRMDHTYIREFIEEEFRFSQVLKVKLPLESHFTHPSTSGSLSLFVLSGPEARATVTPLVFKGAEGFSLDTAVNSMEIRGVQTMEAFVDFHTNTQYITTAGNKKYYQKKSPNNVLEAVYKSSDIETIREEIVASSETNIPEMSRPKCHQMVASYLMELHENEGGYGVASTNLSGQDIGTIMLRVLPRHFIGYDFDALPRTVRNYMSDQRFAMFQQRSPSAAIANIYDETERIINRKGGSIIFKDKAYLGSIYVDQDVDGILYVHGILRLDPLNQNSSRHVTFKTSCEANATEISVLSYPHPKGEYNPQENSNFDGATRTFCAMFHNADPSLVEGLKDLQGKRVGKNYTGAIAVHASNDPNSPVIGCGLLKNTTTARREFLSDHDYRNLPFNPYKPGVTRSPIKSVELWDTKKNISLSKFTRIAVVLGSDGRPIFKNAAVHHLYYDGIDAAWYIGTGWSDDTFSDNGKGRHYRSFSVSDSPPRGNWEYNLNWDQMHLGSKWVPSGFLLKSTF